MLMYTYTYMYVYMCVCVYIYICAVIPHTALLSHSELPQGKFLHRDSPNCYFIPFNFQICFLSSSILIFSTSHWIAYTRLWEIIGKCISLKASRCRHLCRQDIVQMLDWHILFPHRTTCEGSIFQISDTSYLSVEKLQCKGLFTPRTITIKFY